jgi:hypothetical protein
METNGGKSLWVVVLAHSGIPVKVKLFKEYAKATRCQNRWERTASEEYDAVALFEPKVN